MSESNAAMSCEQQALLEQLDSELFKALGDPSRQQLLVSLANQPCCQTVSQIAECCPLSISVVSRHLKMLKDVGVLSAQKQGKEVFYEVNTGFVVSQLRQLADALESCCPQETI